MSDARISPRPLQSVPGRRRSWTVTAAVVGTLAVLAWLAGCGDSAVAQGGPPQAPPVSVAPAVQRPVTDSEEFSGRLEAAEYVELRPRIGGTIDKVHFTDGALVKKDQLLFTIDARPLQAEAVRAESLLSAAKSRAELAQSESRRGQGLLESQAISRQEADQLASSSRTSAADIQAAEAAVRVARLNLAYTQVRSPIAGRVSRALITAGNLVNDQSVLTTIAGVSRIHAYFDSSEQTYLRFRAAGAGGAKPSVRMGLANEQGFPHQGTVDFVDNQLNPQTGAIRLRASFDNPGGQFIPGLAARLRLEYGAARQATLVAERAIGTDQTKKLVYVVGADGMPQPREVKLGALQGGMRVVEGGVKPGEHVVVDGLQRIIPGMKVQPHVLQVDARGMPIPAPPPGGPGGPGAAPRSADGPPKAASAAQR